MSDSAHLVEIVPVVMPDLRILWRGVCVCGWETPIDCEDFKLVEIAIHFHESTHRVDRRRAA